MINNFLIYSYTNIVVYLITIIFVFVELQVPEPEIGNAIYSIDYTVSDPLVNHG